MALVQEKGCVSRQFGLSGAAWAKNPQLRPGSRFHSLAKRDAGLFKKLLRAKPGFGDDFDRAVFKRLQGALRSIFREARTDHHRYRVLAHDLCKNVSPSMRAFRCPG